MLNLRDLPENLKRQILNSKEYLGYSKVQQQVIPTIREARKALTTLKTKGTLFGVPCTKSSHWFDVGPLKDLTLYQAARALRKQVENT